MSRELRSLHKLYKSHKCSRDKQKSPYSKKGRNHLLFLGLESKIGRLHVLAAEEQNTTSTQLKDLFVKEADSLVHYVIWSKRTCDVGEFLKHNEKGDHSI